MKKMIFCLYTSIVFLLICIAGVVANIKAQSILFQEDFETSPVTPGRFTIGLGKEYKNVHLKITDVSGHLISEQSYLLIRDVKPQVELKPGVYIISITADGLPTCTFSIIKSD